MKGHKVYKASTQNTKVICNRLHRKTDMHWRKALLTSPSTHPDGHNFGRIPRQWGTSSFDRKRQWPEEEASSIGYPVDRGRLGTSDCLDTRDESNIHYPHSQSGRLRNEENDGKKVSDIGDDFGSLQTIVSSWQLMRHFKSSKGKV